MTMKDTRPYPLQIDSRYYNTLDIEAFSQMMKDPSYCYKFYWLEAIVRLISENITETTFDAIIDEMIANAWYSVREFHVHLSGLKSDGSVGDGLERAILSTYALTAIASVMSFLRNLSLALYVQCGLTNSNWEIFSI